MREVVWEAPWALAWIAPALLVVLVVARRGTFTSRWPRLQAVLRGLAITLAVVALARPILETSSRAASTLVLVDVSTSIDDAGRAHARRAVDDVLASAPDDAGVGLVVFGGAPVVVAPAAAGRCPSPEELARLDQILAGNGTESALPAATDLAAAIRLGRGLAPRDRSARLLVASDGNATRGDAAREAALARGEGVRVFVLEPATRTTSEVMVERVIAPPLVHVGEPFAVEVQLQASLAGRVHVAVARDGLLLPASRDVELEAGASTFRIDGQDLDEGVHRYVVTITPDEGLDTRPDDNRGQAVVVAAGRPRVLVLHPQADRVRALERALEVGEIAVEVRPPAGAPARREDLLGFDLVILVDVPAAELPAGAMAALAAWVREDGGGLGMVGGERSFGLGGYARTPIEEVLPVTMTVKRSVDDPDLALVSVIDASGSMSGVKISLAREAAIAASEVVADQDRVAVIAFDSVPAVILPLTPAGERDRIESAIATLSAGGGTDIEPALMRAFELLRQDSDARIKHVILLSDGISPGRPASVAEAMRASGITISAVAIGKDADRRMLQDVARAGGGRYYYTDDFAAVPQIFTQETLTASKALLIEEPFLPILRDRDPLLAGIDLDAMPMLLGYVATTIKPDATEVLASERGDPILALRRSGSGYGLAFTADVEGRWASMWIEDWDDFAKLWAQIVRRTMRAGRDGRVVASADLVRVGDRLALDVELSDREGRMLSDLRVRGGSGIELAVVAPGRYATVLDRPEGDEVLEVPITAHRGEELVWERTLAFIEPHSQEARRLAPDGAALDEVAARGGGRVVAAAASVWEPGAAVGARTSLSAVCLLAAALVLLAEAVCRRV